MKLSKMSKEELEVLSYTKIAELYLQESKKTMNTADLFKKICELLNMSEEDYEANIADFFQSLSTTKEFILLQNGEWDLKSKHKVKVNMDDLYEDKDEELEEKQDEEIEELDEEIEEDYDSVSDDDYVDDDLSDLTIVDEDDLNKEEE